MTKLRSQPVADYAKKRSLFSSLSILLSLVSSAAYAQDATPGVVEAGVFKMAVPFVEGPAPSFTKPILVPSAERTACSSDWALTTYLHHLHARLDCGRGVLANGSGIRGVEGRRRVRRA